ncbi:hypothetical protein [Sphingomonas sanxanigenens]|uniref:Uncharacterized protein n=1 Tax=Sphingomonas sanxanigenens DSM 19645 = NX02 TaxID=1123269 RepID=W0A690_9SPHN|nr:hypothetical protein [Sphingomonas sanxanigenens]AHE52566.1 hypothetical protein NX02_04080 [Sphingomonas sanxanigenens DSM 19645 = NX02]
MASSISICNMALAEIGADAIASLEEESVSARECARAFDQCLGELLEMAEWGFAERRTALAELPNDRPGEWQHAYALPADLANAIRVRRADARAPDAAPISFLIAGGKLYCDVAPALFDYGRASVSPAELPALLVRALVLEIAARIAFPVKKDGRLKEGLIRQAEVARARAIADDENRNPRRVPHYTSPVDAARLGWEVA